MHDLQIVFVIEFVARKDAELVSGLEERDGDHENAGKRKCVALCECKILCHVRNLRPEQADPARWLLKGPGTVAITAQSKTSGGSLLADPDSGLIDGDPDLVQDAIHKERDWFASVGQEGSGTDRSRTSQPTRPTRYLWIHRRSAATGILLTGDCLDDLEVHLGTRLDAGDLTGDLSPMPMLAGIALCAAAQGSALRLVVGADRIGFCEHPGIRLPSASQRSSQFNPLLEKFNHAGSCEMLAALIIADILQKRGAGIILTFLAEAMKVGFRLPLSCSALQLRRMEK